MRFVAGRGAVAERLERGAALAERLVRGTADAEPAGRLAGVPLQSKGAAARLRHGTALLWSEGADNMQASPRSTSG